MCSIRLKDKDLIQDNQERMWLSLIAEKSKRKKNDFILFIYILLSLINNLLIRYMIPGLKRVAAAFSKKVGKGSKMKLIKTSNIFEDKI